MNPRLIFRKQYSMNEVKVSNTSDRHNTESTCFEGKKKRRKRSKTGCFTCRLKRKKCDEKRPVCGSCKRNILNCVWPVAGEGKLTQEMRDTMRKEVNFYERSDALSMNQLLDAHDDYSEKLEKNMNTIYPSRNISKFYNNVFKMSYFERNNIPSSINSHDILNHYDGNQIVSFVNHSYDKKHKDFITLREHTYTHVLESKSNQRDGYNGFGPVLNQKRNKTIEKEIAISINEDNKIQKEFSNEITNIGSFSCTDLIWGKMYDLNFSEPLETPNDSLITPVSSKNEAVSKRALTKPSTTNKEHTQYYSLDDEQSETIYSELLTRFKMWSSKLKEEAIPDRNVLLQYQLGEDELLLYYACIHYFLPAIGPQRTLPQLTTTETFLPLINQHSIMKDVFLCCGATFLEWCQQHKYSVMAEDLYQKSKKALKEHEERGLIKGDETWVFASFQLLCLTDKFRKGSSTSMIDRCVDNLAHSFNIIKKKYNTIRLHGSTATERMLIESFIYNYTVSLSVASDLSKLPSPFSKVFHDLTQLLKSPIFHGCDVNWINNPILGSSVDTFELLAKVSFLGRLSLPLKHSKWIERAKHLLDECLYYTPPILPEEIRNDPVKYEQYRPSLLCGSIISKACYLLLCKIIRYDDFQVNDFEIQGVVKYTIQSLRDVEKGNPILCILLWSLLIIGAFTLDPIDRLVIKEYIKSTSQTIHSYGALKIANLLERIWRCNNINLLFMHKYVCEVVI